MKIMGLAVLWAVGILVAQQPTSQVRDVGHPSTKRAMTFADLMAMKRVSDPQVSPGGKWVMFSVTEVSLEKNTRVTNLWVVGLGGGVKANAGPLTAPSASSGSAQDDNKGTGQERQITFGVVDQTGGRFSPDGKWILLISNGGQAESQIWTAKWDEATGTIQKPYPLTSLATGADGAVWSPDSKRILFASGVYPECSVKGGNAEEGPTHHDETVMNGARRVAGGEATWVEEETCDKARMDAEAKSQVKGQLWTGLLYRHWNAYTGKRRSHVLVVSAANGEEIRDLTPASAVGDAETPTFSLGGPLGYAWAPDSKEIAYVANLDKVPAASTNNDVFTLRLDEAAAKAVKVSTSLGSDDGPQYSPDGRWLAFRSQERAGYESDRFRLMVFDRKKKTARELMPKFDRWVDEFVWAPDSKALYFVSADAGEQPIFRVKLSEETPIERITGRGEVGDLFLSRSNSELLFAKQTLESPTELFMVDLPLSCGVSYQHFGIGTIEDADRCVLNARPTQLTHLGDPVLAELSLSQFEEFRFDGAENTTVQGFVVKPPNFDPKKKYPVKFLIHGGPQGALLSYVLPPFVTLGQTFLHKYLPHPNPII